MDLQFLQHYLLKRLSFLHSIAFAPQRSVGHICVDVFLDSLFCSIDLWAYPSTSITLSCLLRLHKKAVTSSREIFKVVSKLFRSCYVFQSILFLQNCHVYDLNFNQETTSAWILALRIKQNSNP